MRTPDFWFHDSGWGRFLSPLGGLYALGGRLKRSLADPFHASVPVICVGNLVLGGAGKTPVVQALVRHLLERGKKPAILLRGYGGTEGGPLLVDPQRHTVKDVGDEALLHAPLAPTIVSRDRAQGAKAAIAHGADCIVMDDGLQNAGLYQDLPLIVIDGATGLGNGRVFPAGPLREPSRDGLARAKAVILIGDDETGVAPLLAPLPVYRARIEPNDCALAFKDKTVVAFAGIGRPEKFFASLGQVGARIALSFPFPDHHAFTACEIDTLQSEALAMKAQLVTTAKDHVRLPETIRDQVGVFRVSLIWEDPKTPEKLLTCCS